MKKLSNLYLAFVFIVLYLPIFYLIGYAFNAGDDMNSFTGFSLSHFETMFGDGRLMLIILPTWINLLLKAYAFIGIFGQNGSINQFLEFIGIGSQQLLFTDFSFIFVASYIELPFMILPIFNVLDDMDNNLINASYDLGATKWETFRHVIFPLSMNGVRSGVQSVFIPSLSLFMLTRLIGGNRVITLGTAIEQNFLTNDNYGMGSTIGVILILTMFITMWVTKERRER